MTAPRQAADKELQCSTCGESFVYSAGEQELHKLRGVSQSPDRCPGCVRLTGSRRHVVELQPDQA